MEHTTDGLSFEELDAETAQYLPPREVMCGAGYRPRHCGSSQENNSYNGNTSGGLITVAVLNGNFNQTQQSNWG